MKEHGINFDLHALASPKSRQDCTLLAQEILAELANIRAHFGSAAARCGLHTAKEQKDTATEALQYIYGNIDLSTWRKVIDEKLTPPWPLPHHAEAMGLSAQQPADCPKCGGTGEADSGGTMPWGAPAMISCDCQQLAVEAQPVAYADPQAFTNFREMGHLGGVHSREWMWAKPDAGLVPLYAHPPPSAPVGVECVRCGDRPEGGETTKLSLLGLVEYARTAVNPSQGATRWHLIDLLEQALPHLEALTQQPAAVDEAMVVRAWAAYDSNGGTAREDIRAALVAALATQQGGRDDGRA